jgi:hypothetical protein
MKKTIAFIAFAMMSMTALAQSENMNVVVDVKSSMVLSKTVHKVTKVVWLKGILSLVQQQKMKN